VCGTSSAAARIMFSRRKMCRAVLLFVKVALVTVLAIGGMVLVGGGWYRNIQHERMWVCAVVLDAGRAPDAWGRPLSTTVPPSAPDSWRRLGVPSTSVRVSGSEAQISCVFRSEPRFEWTWRLSREGSGEPRIVDRQVRRAPAELWAIGKLLLSPGIAWHVVVNALWVLSAAVWLSTLRGWRSWLVGVAVGAVTALILFIGIVAVWPYRHPLVPYGVTLGSGLIFGAVSGTGSLSGAVTWRQVTVLFVGGVSAWVLATINWNIS
jgi:hypothetical protein